MGGGPRNGASAPQAHLCAEAEAACQVAGAARGLAGGAPGPGLDDYMRLPVEQYFVLDPENVTRLGDGSFEFRAPKMSFLGVWVLPTVNVRVDIEENPPRVVLRANECRVAGSALVERLGISDKLGLEVETTMEWRVWEGDSAEGDVEGGIEAWTRLEVWSDIVAPFSALPKRALEASCNAVLRPVVRTLLKTFVRRLGQDYEKWASDPEYRAARRRQADGAASGSVA